MASQFGNRAYFNLVISNISTLTMDEYSIAFQYTTLVLSLVGITIFASWLVPQIRIAPKSEPPHLREAVPYISNTHEFLTDMATFLKRAT